MAETFLSAVVEQKLRRVLTLITDEMITLDFNSLGTLQGIQASIVAIIDMLRDADIQRTRSEPVRRWLIKLKEAAFEAEDVIAEISYNILTEKVHTSFGGRFLRKLFVFSFRLAIQVWMTNRSLQTLKNEGMLYGLQWISSQRVLPRLGPQLEENYPKNESIRRAINDEISKILIMLANPNNRQTFTIIPIVERLGTSRNSLANSVCRIAMEANLFDVSIWVCPPHLRDERQICRKMLQSLIGTNTMGGMTTQDLILEKLEKELFGKRFLLVLDDVGVEVSLWWDRLKVCLSKVSTKTQNAIIFTSCSHELASVAEILSLEVIKEYSEWDMRPIADRVERWTMTHIDVMNGLSLVSCVEFCLRFPDVFPVQKEELVQFWIAEDLVESLEKGNMCFDALVHRCFLHDAEMDENGDVVTWKIHGPTLTYIKSLSKSEDLFRWKWTDQSSISSYRLYKTRSMNFIEGVTSRTLISDCVLALELQKLKSLRTLVVLNSDVEELPSSIGRLKHLRYLDVSNTRIRELPGFITELYNLQTLRFLNCKDLSNLPKTKLSNLMNLKNIAFSFEHQMPSGLGKLKGLQTVSFFVVGSDRGGSLRELESLNELRGDVEITRLEEVRDLKEAEAANLQQKTKLNGLGFQWSYGENDRSSNDEELLESLRPHSNIQKIKIKYYMGNKLPSWLMNIGSTSNSDSVMGNNLVGLTLENCWNCICLPQLGHLPCLKSLTIQHMEKLRCIIDSQFNGNFSSEGTSENRLTLFPALKSLSISWMENLVSWRSPSRRYRGKKVVVFPCLERLSILSCPKFTGFPMESLSALVKVEIKDCDELWFSFREKTSFPRLTHLSIEGCPKLTYLRNWLLSNTGFNRFRVRRCGWLRFISDDLGLQSFLISLEINCCKGLTDFADDILCKLTRLRKLSIGAFSEKLDDFSYLNKINDLPWLEELEIWGSDIFGRKMSHLPNQLQHLVHLDSLKITGFTTMEALPEWLSDLPSLRRLSLNYCWNLEYKSTAATIQRLSNLNHLYIHGCPVLEKHKSQLDKFSGIRKVSWSKVDFI